MLRQRLLFGAILIAVLLALIYADHRLSAWPIPECLVILGLDGWDGMLVTALLVLLVILGSRELHRLLVAADQKPLLVWPTIVNVVLVLVPFADANFANWALADGHADSSYTTICLTIAFLGAALFIAWRGRIAGASRDLAATLLIVFYLGVLPAYIVRLRLLHPQDGPWLLLYFLAAVKFCDMGAYFTGRAIGRHKLIEWLSPKKTVEGLIGGVVWSVVVAMLISWLVHCGAAHDSPLANIIPAPRRAWLFGLVMALAGQAGDLLESLFKRAAQVKDSASAVPAFGGVLDIIDSPLIAAPFAYWIMLQ